MKTYILLISMLLANVVVAQDSKIELLDLVKILSPDSATSTSITPWTSNETKKSKIKWKTALPGKDFTKMGTVALTVKGKILKCQSIKDNEAPCKWLVMLHGRKSGYNSFTLEADNLQFLNNKVDMIDYFFDKKKVKAKLLGKDTESVMYWNYRYLLKIPGEKDIWMKISYENQTGTAAQAENSNYTDLFYIDFFTDKKSFDASF